MGTEYSIIRRAAREIYDLGKARLDLPVGTPTLDQARKAPLRVGTSRAERVILDASGPGHIAMWLIMGTPDRSIFRLGTDDRERLADLLHRASASVDTPTTGLLVADDLIAWADGDDLTLVTDHGIETLGRLGFDDEIENYRRAGGLHRAVARIRGDDR